jgi:predicted dehydrogenase
MRRISAVLAVTIVPYLLPLTILFAQSTDGKPVRLAVAGTTHGHVGWILGKKNSEHVTLVGVYEPNTALTAQQTERFQLAPTLFYTDLHKMLETVKPEAVVAFGSILQHMEIVEACAPRGIHVMVEKPLATTIAQAERMKTLAEKHGIVLLTNFETSWYPTTEKAHKLVVDSGYVGNIRKVVIHDGHEGPAEIGVGPEFLAWLTDPIENGGGALIDFGCYGANLMTYLMNGKEPLTVTAVTQQQKPQIYEKVDDEATIIVTYPGAQCIIQASWNWPFGRKDMEIYGDAGYIVAENSATLRIRNRSSREHTLIVTQTETGVYQDPFAYFADVIRRKIKVPENSPYSLSNNVTVVRILDAARESAATGKTIVLKKE